MTCGFCTLDFVFFFGIAVHLLSFLSKDFVLLLSIVLAFTFLAVH